jgi:anti-sigma regulatory factor (Ser/Thr protein kinase)
LKNKSYLSTNFERIIRSNTGDAQKLIGEALEYFKTLQKVGLAQDVSEFNFRLVLDETVENAISHGNCRDPEKTVSVTIKGLRKNVDLIIEDEGEGFDLGCILDPARKQNFFDLHGRGLCILQHIGKVSWNKKGNCVKVRLSE